MTRVFLGLGSNIDAHRHICLGLNALEQNFGELSCSSIYESEAVGFDGENFLNMVVQFDTDLALSEVAVLLKNIENQSGRDRSSPKFSSRTLDIDILMFADWVGEFDGIQLPRDEILKNAFVLEPLAELAPDALHPEAGSSFTQLWQRYDKNKQRLWRTDLSLKL